MKLQHYQQLSIQTTHQKLHARYFRPFQIQDKIGVVAYWVQLSPKVAIYNIFHVSLLKPVHAFVQASATIPGDFTIPVLHP